MQATLLSIESSPDRQGMSGPIRTIARPDLSNLDAGGFLMTTRITPFLWFDREAEEAAKFYTAVFKNSKINRVVRNTATAPGPTGAVLTVEFSLDGQEFTALNGGPNFHFSQSISFVVHCKTQKEVDTYWEKLLTGGEAQQCGWLKDRFGLSWQIVPDILPDLLADADRKKADRVMQAMMKMVKLDIEGLRKAAEQA
jgi:predicted 3-demethylubiquinone-9 3-methyltransferase (glyoxalase superfamily)